MIRHQDVERMNRGPGSLLRTAVCAAAAALILLPLTAPGFAEEKSSEPRAPKTSPDSPATDAPEGLPERSEAALNAMKTVHYEKGKMSFSARKVPMQELFKTLADVGQFSIENVDLLPSDPVTMTITELREQDCLAQLLKQVPDVNYIFLEKEKKVTGQSILSRVQLYPKDSTGIAPGSGTTYDPFAALMGGGDLFEGGTFTNEGGPQYIPPDEPPKYIPPDEPPVYIPPAEPPRYIPPAEPPQYIPPSPEGGDDQGGGGGQ